LVVKVTDKRCQLSARRFLHQ